MEQLFRHTGPIDLKIENSDPLPALSGEAQPDDRDIAAGPPQDSAKLNGRAMDQITWLSKASLKLSHAEWKSIAEDEDGGDLKDEDRDRDSLEAWKSGIEGEAVNYNPVSASSTHSPPSSDDNESESDGNGSDNNDDDFGPFSILRLPKYAVPHVGSSFES